tara:strand:- start:139 stop:285 length:147 start_codon:yes stop_codon:yes gene_type:complete
MFIKQRRNNMFTDWTKELEELYKYVFEQDPTEIEMELRYQEYKNEQNS